MTVRVCVIVLFAAALVASSGCREEGPMEKAGRAIDERVEELTDDDGPMEKLGERMDDVADAAKDLGEDIADAAEDFGDELSD